MKTAQLITILIMAAAANLAQAQCFSSDIRTMDVQDKDTKLRVAVRWNESDPSQRTLILIKNGQNKAFIGSDLNCHNGNPAKCALDNDGGIVEVFRYSVTGTTAVLPTCLPSTPVPASPFGSLFAKPVQLECIKILARKGEVYVATLEDSQDPIIAVDNDNRDDEIYLKQVPRNQCPAVQMNETQNSNGAQPTGEPEASPPPLPLPPVRGEVQGSAGASMR